MTQPSGMRDGVAKLARTDLQVVRQREGDAVALDHATYLAGVVVEFVAADLGQPEAAARMLATLTVHLPEAHPEARPKLRIPADGPDALAALMGFDTRSELHDVARLLGVDHASAMAAMTARTALVGLIELGQVERFRKVVAEALLEVERLNEKEG